MTEDTELEDLEAIYADEGLAGVRHFLREWDRRLRAREGLAAALAEFADSYREDHGVAVPGPQADLVAHLLASSVADALSEPFARRLALALLAKCGPTT